jgi:hypothetical protein
MFLTVASAGAAQGRIYKVLPQFLDKQGRHALTPSLYDRDAYQAYLRKTPSKRSALRFAVQWKAHVPATEPLLIRVEIRGTAETALSPATVLEATVHEHGWFSHWEYLKLDEKEYRKLGEVTAWRTTLWDGDKLLEERKSFLW